MEIKLHIPAERIANMMISAMESGDPVPANDGDQVPAHLQADHPWRQSSPC